MNDDTKQYFDAQFHELRAAMPTKEDLVALEATIGELKSAMAAKEDLIVLETTIGATINALATHIDERFNDLRPLVRDVENHEKRIKYLEEKLPKLAQA